MAFTWKGLVTVHRDPADRVDIGTPEHLFYLGPMNATLQQWFDRWAHGRSTFYAFATFDGIAIELLYHATVQEWQHAREKVA